MAGSYIIFISLKEMNSLSFVAAGQFGQRVKKYGKRSKTVQMEY